MIDEQAPVLIGAGELVRREGGSPDPGTLMAQAIELALQDTGSAGPVREALQAIAAAPSAGWPDGDPARRAADVLGLPDVATLRSSMQGGNGPQLLVNVLAQRIADGRLEVAAVCSAEALFSVVRGAAADWPQPEPERPAGEVVEGEGKAPNTDEELAVGVIAPIMAYPLIENALMHDAGRTYAEQLALISDLWARFSAVAATQPAAWTPQEHDAQRLAIADAGNRRVSLPYLKLHNSNIQVDQAAAVILCSAGRARSLGVPADRWVFCHAGAHATDEWFLSHRARLDRSPAIRACGEAVFEHAEVGAEELGPVDLYSCFPAAVQLAARELGLPLDRQLTCTGGLTFFGGPGNGYATHGIAAVARALREAVPGTKGLATALGWYATKHALGVYGNAPPARPYRATATKVSDTVVAVAGPGEHDATAETCTVIYERDGSPSYGVLFARLPDGRRALGQTRDAGVMAAMATDGFLGGPVRLAPDRSFRPA